jgi:hypothetical protein
MTHWRQSEFLSFQIFSKMSCELPYSVWGYGSECINDHMFCFCCIMVAIWI